MAQVTVDDISTGGPIKIRFGKREHVFESIEHMRACVRSRVDDLDRELLEYLTMAMMLRRQPNLGNPAAFIGRSNVVDMNQANWGRIV